MVNQRHFIQYSKKPTVILITGVPGVGKSTVAIELAHELGINEVIGTDTIRETMRYYSNKRSDPFLFEVTHCAWKCIGKKTPGNIIKGYKQQINFLIPTILKIIKSFSSEGRDLIIEGPHTPFIQVKSLSKLANVIRIILIIRDPRLHIKRLQKKIETRHGRRKKKWQDHFDEISTMQDFIINNSSFDLLIDTINKKQTIDKIIRYIRSHFHVN